MLPSTIVYSRASAAWTSLTLAASLCSIAPGCARTDPSLNVLLVVIDTVRADHLGCYGAGIDTSPALDALAERSVRFHRAYSVAPWTKPSVASMITGLYPSAHGADTIWNTLPASVETLAEHLRSRGYATAGVVSNPGIGSKNGFAQGYETYVEINQEISTELVASRAMEMLERLATGRRPFLLFVHFFDPHYEYIGHPEIGFASERVGRLDGRHSIVQLRRMRHDLTEPEVDHLRALYDEEIRHTDAGIARLLEGLERLGLDARTLIVVAGDHGEEFLERGWLGHTRTLYEELIRVPLLVHLPSAEPGVVREPVSLVSLTPTILELIGIDVPETAFPTHSFTHHIVGEQADQEHVVFAEVDFPALNPEKRARKKAIVGDRYKLIRDDGSGVLELFDLERDPEETTNLTSSEPEVLRELLLLLDQRTRAASHGLQEAGTRDLPEEEVERLRELGYVTW